MMDVMKVKDSDQWSLQLQEFNTDETSQQFRDFLVFWMDAADTLYSEGVMTPPVAVSKALEVTEQTFGFLSTDWIGQMLLVMIQHWVFGDEVWDGLTFIEKRLVEQATALKIVELQQAAAAGDSGSLPIGELQEDDDEGVPPSEPDEVDSPRPPGA